MQQSKPLIRPKTILFGLILTLLLLVVSACTQEEAPVATRAPLVPTRQPTPTLAPLAPANATATAIAQLPPTETPTPTITPTPTVTPQPNERLEIADTALQQGNLVVAREQLETYIDSERAEDDAQLLFDLALIDIAEGNSEAAIVGLERVLELDPAQSAAHFHLAEQLAADERCAAAIPHYEAFLDAVPVLAGYIQPRIAACYDMLEDPDNALAALEAAAAADAHFLVRYNNRIALATRYMTSERYADAAAVYAQIRAAARTERTRGEMHYYEGYARLLSGDNGGGYFEYGRAVADYPALYTSYLALIELIDAGIEVDDFQRGIIDYYAGAYDPGLEAFQRVLEVDPENYDVHLWLAWTYEGLGDLENALNELETYAGFSVTTAPIGIYEKAKLLHRQNMIEEAVVAYRELAETIPQDENAPDALWQAAVLSEALEDTENAIALYNALATAYSDDANAPEALFRAGLLSLDRDDAVSALQTWETAAQLYPFTEYGQAALVWLLTVVPDGAALPDDMTAQSLGNWYYSRRVDDLLHGIAPFASAETITPGSTDEERLEAEKWLLEQFGVDVTVDSAEWRDDPHRIRGAALWNLGLFEQAKQEFYELRVLYRDDLAAIYQIAIYLSDLGLYSGSIGAAERVMALTDVDPFTAPTYIAKLSYPTYYADLITALADEYGYDPLLQFALIRQESLYESFATSTAIAQGLAQVIPDTGQYIADKLSWPDYENTDLYKPHVGLRFGGFYLAEQLRLFDGDAHAALAAYNGGPGNALNWYTLGGDSIDTYVETVTFPETRLYIERIYTGHAIYRHLYGTTP
ncbi:MAG: transglycosylase SLT domain-containing protein [Anaerolineae bacterium]|nr:transglycosylase SLT domain-containing protein [Anaerolineae bacterium]